MREGGPIGGIPLVLGGNVFGWTAKGDDAYAVLDAFYEAGGRMIDTADVYSRFVPGNEGGESETLLGKWMADRGVRSDILLHTKTGNLPGDDAYTEKSVAAALERSLERLQTDYVDLYYVHKDNADVPVEQIVGAFDATVKAGKVRALGASNFGLDRLQQAGNIAHDKGTTPFTVLQNHYNLLERDAYGPDLQAFCQENGIAMLPYFGLASGFLTGKYRSEDDLKKSMRGARAKKYLDEGSQVLAAMDAIAEESGATLPAIALAWLRDQPGIAAPIASARNTDQLHALLESSRVNLSPEQTERLSHAV